MMKKIKKICGDRVHLYIIGYNPRPPLREPDEPTKRRSKRL